MLHFTVTESVLSPSMPTWMQQTTPLFRLWYASAYVVVAYFAVVSVLAQGLSLPFCLLLLDFDCFWVNANPFQRRALMITLERGWTIQSGLCGRFPFHFKCNNTREDCVMLLENGVDRNQKGPLVPLPRVFCSLLKLYVNIYMLYLPEMLTRGQCVDLCCQLLAEMLKP